MSPSGPPPLNHSPACPPLHCMQPKRPQPPLRPLSRFGFGGAPADAAVSSSSPSTPPAASAAPPKAPAKRRGGNWGLRAAHGKKNDSTGGSHHRDPSQLLAWIELLDQQKLLVMIGEGFAPRPTPETYVTFCETWSSEDFGALLRVLVRGAGKGGARARAHVRGAGRRAWRGPQSLQRRPVAPLPCAQGQTAGSCSFITSGRPSTEAR